MNTLIISTFSCIFEKFKTDVTGFIKGMGVEVVSEYEFAKASEHKNNNCSYSVYTIESIE